MRPCCTGATRVLHDSAAATPHGSGGDAAAAGSAVTRMPTGLTCTHSAWPQNANPVLDTTHGLMRMIMYQDDDIRWGIDSNGGEMKRVRMDK